MNIRLLRQIQKHILKEPGQFIMSYWFDTDKRIIPNCGTAACIAGWAFVLNGKFKNPREAFKQWSFGSVGINRFINILDLTYDQSQRLFYFEDWPDKFKECHVEHTHAFARQAARRIEHFIKTKGAE